MKTSRLHRIYTNIKLIENYSLNLAEDHSHYLKTVLRLKVGDHSRLQCCCAKKWLTEEEMIKFAGTTNYLF